MSIRRDKAKADRFARDAETERQSRRDHAAKAMFIVRRRISSPWGLTACFATGAVAGWRGRSSQGDGNGTDENEGFLERMLGGKVGHIALRLALASLIRSWIQPDAAAETAEAGESVADTF